MADTDPDSRIARLERRLQRERKARADAEAIAERGLRDLYEANQGLEERVLERTAELDLARHAAEAASRAKSAFIAHVSHEVRTPLNGVLGNLELLTTAVDADGAAAVFADNAGQSAKALQRLFDRLLRYVELEGADRTAETAPVKVDAFVESLASRWQTRAAKGGKLLVADPGVGPEISMRTLELELGEAVDELLDNAVRHADNGSLTIATSTSLDRVRIAIVDTGPGVPEDFRAAATPLNGGRAPERHQGGQGLGLALATRLAESVGARLGVEGEDHTSAWIEVPLA
ncbi:MAG: ATP-binding protein [Actinomycetota bacterium]